jgi:Pyruvate/2-oxoacid:ferredoxin oxidoreductase gamma subunit
MYRAATGINLNGYACVIASKFTSEVSRGVLVSHVHTSRDATPLLAIVSRSAGPTSVA